MPTTLPDWLSQIAEAVRSIRFGTVQVTIHNARVVQVEKTEKIRLDGTADLTTEGPHDAPLRADRDSGSAAPAPGR